MCMRAGVNGGGSGTALPASAVPPPPPLTQAPATPVAVASQAWPAHSMPAATPWPPPPAPVTTSVRAAVPPSPHGAGIAAEATGAGATVGAPGQATGAGATAGAPGQVPPAMEGAATAAPAIAPLAAYAVATATAEGVGPSPSDATLAAPPSMLSEEALLMGGKMLVVADYTGREPEGGYLAVTEGMIVCVQPKSLSPGDEHTQYSSYVYATFGDDRGWLPDAVLQMPT
eukprot:NODE_17570_length_936_cov_4.517923.p1 GENE.NODE_17570_length_936_cov_4.517923~~NODE_17570_length_936_cov_4.517923.p1  ORF type:complete len:229 (-),score=40.10 NODE_17570_length_936_cov_4.517923:229-915(-)